MHVIPRDLVGGLLQNLHLVPLRCAVNQLEHCVCVIWRAPRHLPSPDKAAASESRAVEHIAEWEDMDDGAPEWLPLSAARGEEREGVVVEPEDLDDGVQAAILESVREAAATTPAAKVATGKGKKCAKRGA